jgi:hypothetical protein
LDGIVAADKDADDDVVGALERFAAVRGSREGGVAVVAFANDALRIALGEINPRLIDVYVAYFRPLGCLVR